jgi:exodeoxyribonuclease X
MFIRVLDLETTHETPADGGVCELGWCDLHLEGVDLVGGPARWRVGEPQAVLVHPGVRMPAVTSAIHHLIDEDVEGAPPWKGALAKMLVAPSVDGGDDLPAGYAAHSVKFERIWMDPILEELGVSVPMFCTYKLGLRLWPDAPSHSNQALRYHRRPVGLVRDRAMPAHRAGPDAYVTAHHLRDLLEEAAVRSSEKLLERAALISEQPALQVTCHIGDWRGRKWADVDDGFMHWILGKDFDEDVVFTCRYWLERRAKEREAEIEQLRAEGGETHAD